MNIFSIHITQYLIPNILHFMNPTGSLTFLFTDIEGSTKLSQECPDSLPDALEKHNSILLEANNGFVFKIVVLLSIS